MHFKKRIQILSANDAKYSKLLYVKCTSYFIHFLFTERKEVEKYGTYCNSCVLCKSTFHLPLWLSDVLLDRSQRHDKILSESTFSSFKANDSISKPASSLILQKPTGMFSPFADFHFLKVISRNIIDAFTSIFYLIILKSGFHFSKPCKNSYFQVRWCDVPYVSIMASSGTELASGRSSLGSGVIHALFTACCCQIPTTKVFIYPYQYGYTVTGPAKSQ